MTKLKLFVPAIILIGGLTLPATMSFAKKEYTAKEKKGCVYCHTKAGSKDLNKVGECYKAKDPHTLEGCEAK